MGILCNWAAGTLYSFPLAKQISSKHMAFSSFMAGILILVSASEWVSKNGLKIDV